VRFSVGGPKNRKRVHIVPPAAGAAAVSETGGKSAH
jgi:hypothetical protein